MGKLIELDPQIARIVDPRTSRNLLENAHPLEVALNQNKNTTTTLVIEVGPEAPMELTISSDQPWLEPKTKQLSLMGGEKREVQVTLLASVPAAKPGLAPLPIWMAPEFANLCFSWKVGEETHSEYVLVWRKG